METGKLVISLDFELLWGVFDKVKPSEKWSYFNNTRHVIPEILKLFQDQKIHATWATVGMLFNKNWEEWEANTPQILPSYRNLKLSAYHFAKNKHRELAKELCFAPVLIQQINSTAGQEVGTHTYSHYYCLEEGQGKKAFQADLQQAIALAARQNIKLKSLVFPRNQLQESYLEICAELGIENVRSNPSAWYWKNTQSEALSVKLARTGDAYFPLGKKCYSSSIFNKNAKMPIQQPASRFYRPLESNALLRNLKLKRVKAEMKEAAKRKEIYHLWWHPHNFGDHPQDSMQDLKEIVEYYKILENKYHFESLNMQELGKRITQ